MRKAVVLGLGLLLCLVGVVVVAQLLGPSSPLFPVTIPVRFGAYDQLGLVAGVVVTVNPGGQTVVTVGTGAYPVLSLQANTFYNVTALFGQASLTTTLYVVDAVTTDLILVHVDRITGLIERIYFWP